MRLSLALIILTLWAGMALAQGAVAPEPAQETPASGSNAVAASGPAAPASTDTPAQPATQTGEQTAVPSGAAALVQRLDTTNRLLLEINDYLRRPAPDLAGIAVALPGKSQEAESVLGQVRAADPTGTDLVEFAAALQKLRSLDRIFDKWRSRLQDEIAHLDPWREQLRADAGFLRKEAEPYQADTEEEQQDPVPEALRGRLSTLADAIEGTREPLRRRLDAVVAADVRVGELQSELRDLKAQLDATRLDLQLRPLAVTARPLWKPPAKLRQPVELARQNILTLWAGIIDYFDARSAEVTAFALIMVVMLVAVARLRRSILKRGGDPGADELLTHYPFAVTLLIWTLLGPLLLLPDLALGLGLLRGVSAAALLWRILPALATPAESGPVKGLLLLAGAFQGQLIVLGDYWYGRMLTVALGVVAVLVFIQLARRTPPEAGRTLFRRTIHGVAVVAPAIVVAGLIAEVVGARSFSQQAIGGSVFVTLALCTLLAADAILRSVLDAWVSGPGARWFRSVRNWPADIRTWGRRIIRLVLILALLNVLPGILPMLDSVYTAISQFLGTAVSMGSVQLSLGDILWFFVGIALALGVARFVRFVLDEDVLPRMPLALGAASAASRLIYYALVFAGILFALAASGVELSKLTLVVSALGVGIGFGLQNIVNNFVSGLILAFERPVREGDQITLGPTTGRVMIIGLRATRIRTFDGAEVMVPNANLISGELTNWTLSDRARRIDVTVGVEYGSDPVQVQAVLLESIQDLPGLAHHPEPTTLFRGFGASSLDFSLLIWTDDADHRLVVESEARVRILTALRKAGIGIPFPQLDVRLQESVILPGPIQASPLQAQRPPPAATR